MVSIWELRKNRVCVNGKGEVKEVWKSHFERLMNEKTEKEAILSSIYMGESVIELQLRMESLQKCYGGDTVVEWMCHDLAQTEKYQMNGERQLLYPCIKVHVVKMSIMMIEG